MDLGIGGAVENIMEGTVFFFPQFLPVGILMGGILIAFWIIGNIIGIIQGKKQDENNIDI